MNIAQIEKNLSKVMDSFKQETFIYDLLLAYGLPKASITRLKKGNLNLSKVDGELSWKKKVLFKEEFKEDLHITVSELAIQAKQDQRFVIVTDYNLLLAIDTKTDDKLDIGLKALPKHYDFFLPWAGMEKSRHQNENPADVKAAEKMAKLFDEIKADNPDDSPEFTHGLNVFLSRMLFCFFAEDTDIFTDGQFTKAIDSHTQKDGSDLHGYLDKLFQVLNTPEKERKGLPAYLEAFPYVNGGLFRNRHKSPAFTRRSRQAILDSGALDWSAINPDIFGSMIQAVITPEHRGGLGMHYTSVPNIMKVIEPLFLDDLKEAYEKAKGNKKKVSELLNRIHNLKIFDPACGSGNFLIIAYKELRRLEMQILKESGMMALSGITLDQFYGIELDDFAHEIAQLSLWLAEHQMNTEFFKEFGQTNPTLPLKEAGEIVHGNACRIDWESVCPIKKEDEVYLLGNPPYVGSKNQTPSQKDDIKLVLNGISTTKSLDYIACWFIKGARFINEKSAFSFVSTNSLFQGTQVPLIWPIIFGMDIELYFAYKNFRWSNSARGNAGVTCSIVGLRRQKEGGKSIYTADSRKQVKTINPYLLEGKTFFIKNRSGVLSDLPRLQIGNEAYDSGYLTFTDAEKKEFVIKYPESDSLFKKVLGSNELIHGFYRWCLWIDENSLEKAECIKGVKDRIEKVREFRESGGMNARSCMDRPYQFRWVNRAEKTQIVLPVVSSERRDYIPMAYVNAQFTVINSAQVIYDPEPYVFALLNSKIHLVWAKFLGGKLETRYRYNAGLCYNTFPWPNISAKRKDEITQGMFRILQEREKHPEKTLAHLYDPDKMPEGLREAHHQNDLSIERCYRSKPFESDEERLEYLFKLYEQMIEEEKSKGGLFEETKKTRKRR